MRKVKKILAITKVKQRGIAKRDAVSRPRRGVTRRRPEPDEKLLALDPSVAGWVPLPISAAKHLKDSSQRRERYEKGLSSLPILQFTIRDGKITRER